MFDIAPTELMLVALVALVVIGPKDLPRVMRVVGHWVGQARGMARHFRAGIDEMMRQSELEEMERKWAEENARIMAEHPLLPAAELETAAAEPPVMKPLDPPPPLPSPPAHEAAAAPPREGELPFPDRPA